MTVAVAEHGSALALTPDQTDWTEQQLVALRHIGVEQASPGDLMVFHHVCQRTGLDPFARQIHMLGRRVREEVDGEWKWVTKQTIQTGIDGFRLIGRRAADSRGQRVSVEAPQWAHAEGGWRDVWMNAWGYPVAARVTIRRDGEPFTAVAMFDEYKQTKKDGSLTRMWEQRRAGQLAKCAEALAWRMAFPQDLAGLYSDDEMGQASNAATAAESPTEPGRRGIGDALREDQADVVEGEVVEEPGDQLLDMRTKLARRMLEAMDAIGVTITEDRLDFASDVVGHRVEKPGDLTVAEAERVALFAEERLAAIKQAEQETEGES